MTLRRRIALLLAMLLAACASQPAAPPAAESGLAGTVSVALRLTLAGRVEAALGDDPGIAVAFLREGSAEPVALEFARGALGIHDLAPGRYAISRIGPLACTGLAFDIAPGSRPRALGTLSAEIVETEYHVALLAGSAASAADLAALADAAPGEPDARPLAIGRGALCHAGRHPNGTTYRDLSPGEQVMLAVFFAGFCAAAVASGGFCAF